MGDGELGGSDARYLPPQGWYMLGPDTTDGELAAAATEWIAANVGFLCGEADKRRAGGDLWSAAEVVSRIATRCCYPPSPLT